MHPNGAFLMVGQVPRAPSALSNTQLGLPIGQLWFITTFTYDAANATSISGQNGDQMSDRKYRQRGYMQEDRAREANAGCSRPEPSSNARHHPENRRMPSKRSQIYLRSNPIDLVSRIKSGKYSQTASRRRRERK